MKHGKFRQHSLQNLTEHQFNIHTSVWIIHQFRGRFVFSEESLFTEQYTETSYARTIHFDFFCQHFNVLTKFWSKIHWKALFLCNNRKLLNMKVSASHDEKIHETLTMAAFSKHPPPQFPHSLAKAKRNNLQPKASTPQKVNTRTYGTGDTFVQIFFTRTACRAGY